MIEENEQLPDWLVELRDQQLQQQSQEPPPLIEEPPGMDRESLVGDLRSQMAWAEERMAQAEAPVIQMEEPAAPPGVAPVEPEPDESTDVLESWREQMLIEAAEEEREFAQRRTLVQTLMGLKPAQRLLLSILLFLNVAMCGCLILIMLERVELPF
jgi:hypothetical protein